MRLYTAGPLRGVNSRPSERLYTAGPLRGCTQQALCEAVHSEPSLGLNGLYTAGPHEALTSRPFLRLYTADTVRVLLPSKIGLKKKTHIIGIYRQQNRNINQGIVESILLTPFTD